MSASGERRILAEAKFNASAFFSADQDISGGTTWSIQREPDTVIVHLDGPIHRLETELDGCGSAPGSPMAGEVWVVPSGQRYSSEALGGLVHYAELRFDRSLLDRIADKSADALPVLPKAGCFDNFLFRGALRLQALTQSSGDLSQLAAESLSQTLLLDFYCRYREPSVVVFPSRRVRLSSRERRLIEDYVEEHLDSALRLDSMASRVRMTSHEFLIAFRIAFGATPAQFVIERRLRRARRLLRSTSKSIAEIAFATGFSSHAHLTTAFRNRLQMTPRQFRQELKSE